MPCTTVLAGKLATNDRSTMIARTDDGHFDEKKLIVVEPDQQPKIYKSVSSEFLNFVWNSETGGGERQRVLRFWV